jgi:hypothetical protein
VGWCRGRPVVISVSSVGSASTVDSAVYSLRHRVIALSLRSDHFTSRRHQKADPRRLPRDEGDVTADAEPRLSRVEDDESRGECQRM